MVGNVARYMARTWPEAGAIARQVAHGPLAPPYGGRGQGQGISPCHSMRGPHVARGANPPPALLAQLERNEPGPRGPERGAAIADPSHDALAAVAAGQARLERKLDALLDSLSIASTVMPQDSDGWVDARWVAERYGVRPEWVRRHKAELGCRRLSEGKRPRLRFSSAEVERAMPQLVRAETAPSAPQAAPPERRGPASSCCRLAGNREWANVATNSMGRHRRTGPPPEPRRVNPCRPATG